MPLPFLIGGLLAAAAAAVAAVAFSDDEKSSSSSSSSSSDEAERRRKEAAEKERKERERTLKQQAAYQDFQKQGRAFGKNLSEALPSELVKASGTFTLDFDLKKSSMQIVQEKASLRNSKLLVTINSLETILTKKAAHQKIIEDLTIFSELYKPEFQYGTALQKKEKRVTCINEGAERLKKIKTLLMKLEIETASAQA